MSLSDAKSPFVAIACGGTGGHLFPGLAVAGQLKQRGCSVALLISPKEVDQQAVKSAEDLEIFTLPAVGLQNRNYFSFARSFWQSWRTARKLFQARRPQAVLAMGGFTSAPPVLAGKALGVKTFLHESNTIPGRANRFLAPRVDAAFVGFTEAGGRLRAKKVSVTGTPVRPQFYSVGNELASAGDRPSAASANRIAKCRVALGLDPGRPVVLVMGGSQGASGLNDMVLSTLSALSEYASAWQWLHLTGNIDFEKVKSAYAARGLNAVVKPFLAEMDLALGAATASVSRSGASSLAEIAAMRLPTLLVPYPTAADNHQWHNARAFETTGAARMLQQKDSTPGKVAGALVELVTDSARRVKIQNALANWHSPKAAEVIAESILTAISVGQENRVAGMRAAAAVSSALPPEVPKQQRRSARACLETAA